MLNARMADMVAFRVHFWGIKPICRASSYSRREIFMFRIRPYASQWITLTKESLFFWPWIQNWVPRSAHIPAQSSALWKEMTMVWSPSTRENNAVQSSGVAVKVSKTNMVWKSELYVSQIAGCHRMGWHWQGKLEIFHVHSHDRLHVKADQHIAREVRDGLGSQSHPETSG
uniref:Uncharacterized protein n=1 Tax=Romanomermis culicivorax TaxID=13658 RepID=A0A915JTC4_ROMCU